MSNSNKQKITKTVSLLFCFFCLFFAFSTNVKAQSSCNAVFSPGPDIKANNQYTGPLTRSFSIRFDGAEIKKATDTYPAGGTLNFSFPNESIFSGCSDIAIPNPNNPQITIPNNINNPTGCERYLIGLDLLGYGKHTVNINYEVSGEKVTICTTSYELIHSSGSCGMNVNLKSGSGDPDSTWEIAVSDIIMPYDIGLLRNASNLIIMIDNTERMELSGINSGSTVSKEYPKTVALNTAGTHNAIVYGGFIRSGRPLEKGPQMCFTSFNILEQGMSVSPTPAICAICEQKGLCDGSCSSCPHCESTKPPQAVPELKPICDQIDPKQIEMVKNCKDCFLDTKNGAQVWTAIGCLPLNIGPLIKQTFLGIGVGIAGGIAFLYFLYGAFLILTSAGNPEAIEEAKQIIVSALSGLLLIIFSIFLLKVIGVDILRLPGFSG